MDDGRGIDRAASLFKVLSSSSRLNLLRLLAHSPATVSTLVETTGQSQPLVSQHLKVLRSEGLVVVSRSGREAVYEIADRHVAHIVEDAIQHVLEHTERA